MKCTCRDFSSFVGLCEADSISPGSRFEYRHFHTFNLLIFAFVRFQWHAEKYGRRARCSHKKWQLFDFNEIRLCRRRRVYTTLYCVCVSIAGIKTCSIEQKFGVLSKAEWQWQQWRTEDTSGVRHNNKNITAEVFPARHVMSSSFIQCRLPMLILFYVCLEHTVRQEYHFCQSGTIADEWWCPLFYGDRSAPTKPIRYSFENRREKKYFTYNDFAESLKHLMINYIIFSRSRTFLFHFFTLRVIDCARRRQRWMVMCACIVVFPLIAHQHTLRKCVEGRV